MKAEGETGFNLLWLQAGSCGGCTMAAMESGQSGWFDELKAFGINLLWHPSFSERTGAEALEIFESILADETPAQLLEHTSCSTYDEAFVRLIEATQ